MKRGFAPILIVLVVLIIGLVGYFGYINYVVKHQGSSAGTTTRLPVSENPATPNIKPTTSQAAQSPESLCKKRETLNGNQIPSTWKTYTDNRFHYQIRYPSNLITENGNYYFDPKEPDSPNQGWTDFWAQKDYVTAKQMEKDQSGRGGGPLPYLEVEIEENSAKLTLYQSALKISGSFDDCTLLTINGHTALSYSWTGGPDGMTGNNTVMLSDDKTEVVAIMFIGETLDTDKKNIIASFTFGK